MKAMAMVALVVASFALPILSLLYVVPAIHAWERENGYPYGRMCDVTRSCPWDR